MKYQLVFAALVLTLTPAPALAQATNRVRIGIVDIEYRAVESTQNKNFRAYGWNQVSDDTRAFVDMLTTALVRTQKFDVIERHRMAAVLQEQGLSVAGITAGSGRLSLTGLDYIVTGAITQYGLTTEGASFGGIGTAKTTATMAVDIRVVDTEDGLTRIAESVVAGQEGGRGFSASGSLGGRSGTFVRSSDTEGKLLGDVMRAAAMGIAFLIVEEIYPIRVAAVTEDEIILNYGDGLLAGGELLEIYSEGESFVDPTSGEELGSVREFVASVRVTSSESRFSRARVIKSEGVVEAGMIATVVPEKEEGKSTERRKLPGSDG